MLLRMNSTWIEEYYFREKIKFELKIGDLWSLRAFAIEALLLSHNISFVISLGMFDNLISLNSPRRSKIMVLLL